MGKTGLRPGGDGKAAKALSLPVPLSETRQGSPTSSQPPVSGNAFPRAPFLAQLASQYETRELARARRRERRCEAQDSYAQALARRRAMGQPRPRCHAIA